MKKVRLCSAYGWRGKIYLPGDRVIPDDLATALGLAASSKPKPSAALKLINEAKSPGDITPLPTIGLATAKDIFGNRPESGYSSLDEVRSLNKSVASRIAWDEVAKWEPS